MLNYHFTLALINLLCRKSSGERESTWRSSYKCPDSSARREHVLSGDSRRGQLAGRECIYRCVVINSRCICQQTAGPVSHVCLPGTLSTEDYTGCRNRKVPMLTPEPDNLTLIHSKVIKHLQGCRGSGESQSIIPVHSLHCQASQYAHANERGELSWVCVCRNYKQIFIHNAGTIHTSPAITGAPLAFRGINYL